MNETFVIPDRSSLYNIKSIFNALVEEIGRSGLTNLLINGRMDQKSRDGAGNLILPGWVGAMPLDGPSVTFGAGDWLRQYMPRLYPNTVYTLVLDVHNVAELTASVIGTAGSQINDFFEPYPANPSYTIPVSYDELNQPQRQQLAFTFVAGAHDQLDPPRFELSSAVAQTLQVHNFAVVKGTFGFNTDNAKSIFMDTVRIVEDGVDKAFYEVSKDGITWHRLLTTEQGDLDALFDSGQFLTIAEMDSRYLRKDVDDTCWGQPTFDQGFVTNDNVEVGGHVRLAGGDIVGNYHQAPGAEPTRSFYINVRRGDQPTVGLRYNEGIDRWEFTHDGFEWQVFGSGTGGGGSAGASSELEYYAEILDRSGFKEGYYDLFDSEGQTGDVIPTNASYVPDNGGYYTAEVGSPGPWIIRTLNVWNSDNTSSDLSMFVHALTDQNDSTGISVWYARATDGTDTFYPPAVDSTHWVPWGHNDVTYMPGVIDNFYLKFAIDSTDVQFHSFGLFFGSWAYSLVSDTRLREYYTVPSDSAAPTLVTVPNAGRYTNDGESLEVYHNRVRLVLGTDYDEVDPTTIRMLVDVETGDVIEFYEKYGYTLDSTSRDALQVHLSGGVDRHQAYEIGFDPSGSAVTTATDVQQAIEDLDGAVQNTQSGLSAVQLYISSTF